MGMLLQKATKGKVKKPPLILLYGPDGVGKSSFGAQAPKSIFLCAENGTDNLDVNRLPALKMWSEVFLAISELTNDKHDYQTLVIDSLDWIEPLLHRKICEAHGVKSIELAAGGYGKGYVEAQGEWLQFKDALITLREKRGMNIILLAHADIAVFNDPNIQATYDRYQIKLHKKASALMREFVDNVLFANYVTHPKKEGAKHRVYGDDARAIYTQRRPGFDAKNRFGLPFSFPLSYTDFETALANSTPNNPEKIKEAIDGMIKEIGDEELKKLVLDTVEKAGNDSVMLSAIENRLRIRVEEANG